MMHEAPNFLLHVVNLRIAKRRTPAARHCRAMAGRGSISVAMMAVKVAVVNEAREGERPSMKE